MTCTSGDCAIVWRVHASRGQRGSECVKACIGRVIVQVTTPFVTGDGGLAWNFAGEAIPCPVKPLGCRILAFYDYELKPLPPEEAVKDHDLVVELGFDPETVGVIHIDAR